MTWRTRWVRSDETAYMKVVAIAAGAVVGVSLLAMIIGISSKGYSILMRTTWPSPQEAASKAKQAPTRLSQTPADAPESRLPNSVPIQSPDQAATVKQFTGSSRQSANLGATQRGQLPTAIPLPATSGKTRIVLKANQGTWIDACSDGRTVFRRYLPPPNSVHIEFSSEAVIRLGNSGGIETSVDGKSTGPLGVLGQTRVVQFDSKGFHFLMPGDPGAECGK
jgi:uncharacterized protein DUF4115